MGKQSFPGFVTQYFWGDDLGELDLQKNKKYILQVLLERGNEKAIRWLFDVFGIDAVKSALSDIKLSKKSANFWNIYLS